jgi:hypothetical protein
VRRPKFKVAVGIFTGHTALRSRMCKQWRIGDCGRTKKKTVCILCVTVLHWHEKDTELWVVCFQTLKDLENVGVNSLISPVANTRLDTAL